MKSKFRISLRAKFILIFAAILLVTIAGIAVANRILLSKLYERDKRKALTDAYRTVNSLSSVQDELELDKISSVEGINIYICDGNGEEVFASVRNSQYILPMFLEGHEPFDRRDRGPQEEEIGEGGPRRPEPPSDAEGAGEAPPPEDGRHGWGRKISLAETAEEMLGGEKYVIRYQSNERLGDAFMGLLARLDNGNYLFLQTTMAPVGEAADTANELLLLIGAVALLVGVVIVFVAASAATRPIRQLTEIAGDMSSLNFSRRYEGKSKDEVGDLGRSINIMSQKLEENINQLRESNAKLEKDIELKDSIDRMRKEFIANASHELKTPIALIGGYAEGLKENIAAGPEDREFYCDVIMDEAAKMDKVIKQILTMAELENAGERLEKTSVNFTGLAESAAHSFDILARKKRAAIETDCQEGIEVTADPVALEQAVNNYITNAINHVDENGTIRVTLRREGEKARFGVYNSGARIPDGGADLIWESFGKLDKARTRAYGGSGLGLAIVKKCVELHGGEVGFENRDGGVEFYFTV